MVNVAAKRFQPPGMQVYQFGTLVFRNALERSLWIVKMFNVAAHNVAFLKNLLGPRIITGK
jgi:hypothetical protein